VKILGYGEHVFPLQVAFLLCVRGQGFASGEFVLTEQRPRMQSRAEVSKVFTLALALARDGDSVWRRVGKEPSGNPFNSLVQVAYEQAIPRDPFINEGALVITDRLLSLTGDAWGVLRDLLRAESGNRALDFDSVVAASEAEHGHRNSALAHFMASYGNMENPVARGLAHCFWECSLAGSCAELARACGFLARHGQRATGERLLTRSQVKQVNVVTLTCGTYDAAGEFAYRVGLPGQAIIPNRCGLCVWSLGLDARGNSMAGVGALDRFTPFTGLSVL
jgi:glutaminase